MITLSVNLIIRQINLGLFRGFFNAIFVLPFSRVILRGHDIFEFLSRTRYEIRMDAIR